MWGGGRQPLPPTVQLTFTVLANNKNLTWYKDKTAVADCPGATDLPSTAVNACVNSRSKSGSAVRLGVLWRAEITQPRVRLGRDGLHERGGEPGFADPGLTGQQHHLAFAILRLRPPAKQQIQFLVAAYQRRQRAIAMTSAHFSHASRQLRRRKHIHSDTKLT